MQTRGWLVLVLLATAAVLLLGRAITSLIVSWEWYAAFDLAPLFWERVTDTLILQGSLALVGSIFAFLNLTAVRSTILAVAVPQRVGNLELTAMVPGQRLVWLSLLLAVLLGLALALPFDDWRLVSLARHGIAFGEIEGYHDRDLGFYVYWLPLEETVYLWALLTLVVTVALVVICYALTRSLRVDGRRIVVSSHVRRHMSVLGALVLLLLAWSYRLDAFDLLRHGSGPDGLFMRVDHVVTLRVDDVLSVLAAVAALLILRTGWIGQIRASLVIVGGMLLLAVGLRHVLPALIQRGNTIGEPARREADYLATRALVSRRAFDADGIRMPGNQDSLDIVSRIPIEALPLRLSLWDVAALNANRGSGERGFLDAAAPSIARTDWGTVGLLVAQRPAVTGEGWRVIMHDLATPAASAEQLDWEPLADSLGERAFPSLPPEPLVAPGLTDHRIVADDANAIPGPRLDGFLTRIAHAWSARDLSLLSADSLAAAPVFVSHRDVRSRLEMLAPILAQGSDVSPVWHQATLYWVVHLYSASRDYPLSQPWGIAGEVWSYFRHAGTAVVHAGTGAVRILQVTRPDPIARTWMEMAPSLWVTADELPAGLLTQLPPPTDGAVTQLRTFARHGSRFEGSIARHFPDSAFVRDVLTPVLVTVNDELTPAWTVPLLSLDEQVAGIATVVGGRAQRVVWDTTSRSTQPWPETLVRLRQALDSVIGSPTGRRDVRNRAGRIHTAMTSEGPAVLQALHHASDVDAPVQQVSLMLGDQLSSGRTMVDAVRASGAAPLTPPSSMAIHTGEAREPLIRRLYDAMRDALRRADWIRFGATFDSLGQVLGRPPQ